MSRGRGRRGRRGRGGEGWAGQGRAGTGWDTDEGCSRFGRSFAQTLSRELHLANGTAAFTAPLLARPSFPEMEGSRSDSNSRFPHLDWSSHECNSVADTHQRHGPSPTGASMPARHEPFQSGLPPVSSATLISLGSGVGTGANGCVRFDILPLRVREQPGDGDDRPAEVDADRHQPLPSQPRHLRSRFLPLRSRTPGWRRVGWADLLLIVICMPPTLLGLLLKCFIFGHAFCRLVSFLQRPYSPLPTRSSSPPKSPFPSSRVRDGKCLYAGRHRPGALLRHLPAPLQPPLADQGWVKGGSGSAVRE